MKAKNIERDDQIAVNAVLPQYKWFDEDGIQRISLFDGTDVVNGYTYFHKMIPQQIGYLPVVVHANYILGRKNKRQHMMLHGLWKWLPKSKKCRRRTNEWKGGWGSDWKNENLGYLHLPPQRSKKNVVNINSINNSSKLLILTCSTSGEMLSNFYLRYTHFQNKMICPVKHQYEQPQIFEGILSMEEKKICTKMLSSVHNSITYSTVRNINCRSIRSLVLSSILNDSEFSNSFSGVLWLDVGIHFLLNPFILSTYSKFDVLVSSTWQPKDVVANEEQPSSTTIRIASNIALRLRTLKILPPLPSTDIIFIRKKTKNFINPSRLMEIQLMNLIGRKCLQSFCPGSYPFVHNCSLMDESILRIGMLDPLIYVKNQNYQLALDINLNPVHAIRYKHDIKNQMLIDNVWNLNEKTNWKLEWNKLSILSGWTRSMTKSMEKNNIDVKRVLSLVPNHHEHQFICMFKKDLIEDPIAPLSFLLSSTHENLTVHYFMNEKCKKQNHLYNDIDDQKCSIVKRFITRRLKQPSMNIIYHNNGPKQNSELNRKQETKRSKKNMISLIEEVSKSYPFLKCDVALIDVNYKNDRTAASITTELLETVIKRMMKTGGVVKYF